MGLYVEVMCDEHKGWPNTDAYAGKIDARCWSDRNANPQGHSVAEARSEARKQKWIIDGGYACCPACTKIEDGERQEGAG